MNPTQLVIPLAVFALASSALASGSAPTRPPRPPGAGAPAETMDDARYALGKSVYTGKAPQHPNPAAAKQQKARLSHLAAESGDASLPKLAGRLSAEQLDALDYYISKRYGTK
jgi:hypothetical protein